MNIMESFKMAVDSIFANKMRSFLTMLGIIIGISAVIAILAVGNGATTEITSTFDTMGATMVSLSTNSDATDQQKINEKDLETIKENISGINYISPIVTIPGTIDSNQESKTAVIMAGTPDIQYIGNAMSDETIYGRYFNTNEYDEAKKVAVISSDAARSLFNGNENVVGQHVTIKTQTGQTSVKIVGVSKSTVDGLVGSFDSDDLPGYISVPFTLIKELSPAQATIGDVYIKLQNKDDIEQVSSHVVSLLETRHDAINQNLYKATNFLQALDQVDTVLGLFINFIAAVAAIALLVGGIGVMNIMLVSVTERTREIGTRKALGATNGNIMFQFLMESVILCLIGGLIGLTLGVSLASLVASALNIQAQFTLNAVLSVLLFSSIIGIFFGVYPARKAARLDPIEALRYE